MGRVGWLRKRSAASELLDESHRWPEEVQGNLEELAWTNRWFGATNSLRSALRPIASRDGARVLDVGTGNGGTLGHLGTWASKRGLKWHLVGLDLVTAHLQAGARPRGVTLCAGNALNLPFLADSFDAVISLQTLHHFSEEAASRVLREMCRVSRGLVVVSDLRRGLLPYLGAKALATFVWRNRLIRHDGPISVMRAFTRSELHNLGKRAGAEHCAVRGGPFRLVMTAQAQQAAPSTSPVG